MHDLSLTDDEMNEVRAALEERRFERNSYRQRNAMNGHSDCCEMARTRQKFQDEVNAHLDREIKIIDGVLARLPEHKETA